MAWSDSIAKANASKIARAGQPITYSRPDSANFDAIAPFTINGIVSTGGEYASPTGPLFGSVFVLLSDISLGPQRGDLVIPTVTQYSVIAGRTYRVEEIYLNASEGSAALKVRWTGQ